LIILFVVLWKSATVLARSTLVAAFLFKRPGERADCGVVRFSRLHFHDYAWRFSAEGRDYGRALRRKPPVEIMADHRVADMAGDRAATSSDEPRIPKPRRVVDIAHRRKIQRASATA
jgi:hypothetical protein